MNPGSGKGSGDEHGWFVAGLDVVEVGGRDALAYLQTKLTCDTRAWRRDGVGYGYAVTINGKALFDGHFGLDGGRVLGLFPPGLGPSVVAHFDRWVIREDVRLADLTADFVVIGVLGAGAATAVVAALGVGGDDDQGWRPGVHGTLWTRTAAGLWPGGWLLVGRDAVPAVSSGLVGAGVAELGADAVDRFFVRRGVARFGRELSTDETIPLECGGWAGVSFNKGCYLGQEVIERLFSRGAAARRLMRGWVEGPAPSAGVALLAADDEVGVVASSAVGPDGAWVLAWVRRRVLGDAPEGSVNVGLSLADGRAVRIEGFAGGVGPG